MREGLLVQRVERSGKDDSEKECKHTLATMGMSKAGRANWLAASHPERLSPRLSALSNEAAEAELEYLLTRVSMVERGAEEMGMK